MCTELQPTSAQIGIRPGIYGVATKVEERLRQMEAAAVRVEGEGIAVAGVPHLSHGLPNSSAAQ